MYKKIKKSVIPLHERAFNIRPARTLTYGLELTRPNRYDWMPAGYDSDMCKGFLKYMNFIHILPSIIIKGNSFGFTEQRNTADAFDINNALVRATMNHSIVYS